MTGKEGNFKTTFQTSFTSANTKSLTGLGCQHTTGDCRNCSRPLTLFFCLQIFIPVPYLSPSQSSFPTQFQPTLSPTIRTSFFFKRFSSALQSLSMAFWLFSCSHSSFPCQLVLDFFPETHHNSCPSILFSFLGPRLSGSLSSSSVLCSQPTPSLQISLDVLQSQPHSTNWFNSPCQNSVGFLTQISNTNSTSRCLLLRYH